MNKKYIFIKLLEPSERRKYVFLWPEKRDRVHDDALRACICSFFKKDRCTYKENFSYNKEVHLY